MLRCLTMLPQHVRGICSRITHGVSPHAPYGSQPSSGQSQRDSMIVQNPRYQLDFCREDAANENPARPVGCCFAAKPVSISSS